MLVGVFSCVFNFFLSFVTYKVFAIFAVKTRVMNQPTNKDGTGLYYKNSLDCLQKTVKNEGFFALYKGFIPIWMRLGKTETQNQLQH